MLITLECILLALQAVAAVRLALESPFESASPSNNRLSKRSPVELGGVVPLPSSSNDIGLAPESTPSGEPVTIKYKGEEYNGVTSTATVTIPGTSITDINLPVLAVEKQSADSVGINPNLDGIFGFAYPLLSNQHPQVTAMDALYNGGAIPSNEVSLQLCQYDMLHESFINIGNTEITPKCGTDGKSVAWVQSPTNNQFSINIKILPEKLVATLINAILDSNAITSKNILLRRKLDKEKVKKKLQANSPMFKYNYNIKWEKLPTVSIVMFAQTPVTYDNSNSVVTIKLGPRDYMWKYDSEKFRFSIKAGSNDKAALDIPFMSQLAVTFDRTHKRIGFGPGCGCETATSEYPTISNSDRVLWPLTQLTEQPSTSGSDGAFIRKRKP
ncbi:hypothetical protein BATDEDRAFT_25680 [Batrachochytrium dendrobatidis JAM81]|uniref:Peptidase A1 domain-containing protein n=1 Tax=Batrachochytrium dendrobatidis (strain JAM81 / FGSC 10211) TaxID=684364 RepID=F4P595_BATDJ|nr:uncharacterized protein BATDEDRAFT_25680 [Batrachochytrium dendrobatidis JAM81]EGF79155.1 hypothetical protein BATDEDRAFT_25680 [Batrachochytrium dendrobatidis JAM81]|eukprot:XP_006679848.1 hypothetical protein BATDEDRAFT_25680 [Batrachochytrium dendrobatidis JAM81]